MLGAALAILISTLVSAATTEQVVVDRRTGLAIHGFDPVAYFTDARPSVGREELEFSYAGAVWRFRNPGNRSAFTQDPEVYMPQFGGYDPVVLAQGVATAGHPHVWLIAENRLYLFRSHADRDAFVADPRRVSELAQANWPQIARGLVR